MAAKVNILETTFHSLVNEVFECLEREGVSLGTFYAKVSSMKLELKNFAGDYFEESFGKVVAYSSLAIFWGKLNRFWDFFNYELFQHVVETMLNKVNDALLCKVSDYVREIEAFSESTKVCDFYQVWPFSTRKPQAKDVARFKRMVVEIDKHWEDCTLRDVKYLTRRFAHDSNLPQEFLLLAGVGKGSVFLFWYAPSSVASSIEVKVKDKSNFMSDNGILSITIDDLQVYPLTQIRQCSKHLKRIYELVPCHKSTDKLLMPFRLALITKFTIYNLDDFSLATLRGNEDDIRYQKSRTTISSLGTLPDGSPARLVLLEGAPGSGKTFFSFDAVLKWMKKEILTDISLLALFPLRDYNLRKVTNLLELLALITPDHESLMEELEANKGEGMAFWFDGWDEIASSLDGHSSIYELLVSGEILPKARVIVTSRSWATDYIKEQQDQQPSQHLEILSSYQDQINWLLEPKLKELPIIGNFLPYLEENPAIRGNMHTPLSTEITLEVYQWSQEFGSPLPATVTQLYTSYTCLCIHKYLDNHSHFQPKMWKTNNFRDLPEPLHSWFFSLCRLAFDGLEDGQRLVFPDVPNHLRLETLGLMQAQAPLYASEESAVVSYHYKHLTLQEFLSALLLSWMSDEEGSEIVERCVSDGRYTMTLKFLGGLTKSPPILRDHMRRMLNSKKDKDKLTVFHWLFEGGDKAFTADILNGERKIMVSSDYFWSALDYFVTAHCIARSNCTWYIHFFNAHVGDVRMTQFLQALSSADGEQGNPHISFINLSGNGLTSRSLCHLQDIPPQFLHHLNVLNVSLNDLDHTAVEHIAQTIPHMPQLEVLDLSCNRGIRKKGAVSLMSALCDHNPLRSLLLYKTDIGEEDCKQLARLLSCSSSLNFLNIRYNSLSSDSVQSLFKGLQLNTSLTQLFLDGDSNNLNHISLEAMKTLSAYLKDGRCKLEGLLIGYCDISSETAVELASGLRRNFSVKELCLSHNPIGDKGATALSGALTENKAITTLWLTGCDITTNGGAALASSLMDLTVNSTLERLYISENSLGGTIPAFAQLLQHNKTLKNLEICHDNSLSQSHVDILLTSLAKNRTLHELVLPKKFKGCITSDKRVEFRRWSQNT